MTTAHQISATVQRFATAEERDLAFRDRTGLLVPQLVAGRHPFFTEVRHWKNDYGRQSRTDFPVTIPPDATVGLSYPYPVEELSAALSLRPASERGRERDWLSSYRLPDEVLTRPTIALSGGERVLLSLLRAEILAPATTSLVMCSPTQWLFSDNYDLVSRSVSAYESSDKPVDIFALDGELLPSEEAAHSLHEPAEPPSALAWELELFSPLVIFPRCHFPYEAPEKRIRFVATRRKVQLQSPTLLRGPNGVGKTTLVRVLAGCFPLAEGFMMGRVSGYRGPARLLMQCCVTQLFGLSPIEHLEHVFQCDADRLKLARNIFFELQEAVARDSRADPLFGDVGDREAPDSLLQAKLALSAARLAGDSPLLILDEPLRSLSVKQGRSFLEAVMEHAHKRRIAVLIIAHMEGAIEDLVHSTISLDWIDGDRSSVSVVAS